MSLSYKDTERLFVLLDRIAGALETIAKKDQEPDTKASDSIMPLDADSGAWSYAATVGFDQHTKPTRFSSRQKEIEARRKFANENWRDFA